jgi:hypothetical protein
MYRGMAKDPLQPSIYSLFTLITTIKQTTSETVSTSHQASEMKEAFIFAGPKVTIEDVDFPILPSANHLIIKVVVSGSNPKDWAIAERGWLT